MSAVSIGCLAELVLEHARLRQPLAPASRSTEAKNITDKVVDLVITRTHADGWVERDVIQVPNREDLIAQVMDDLSIGADTAIEFALRDAGVTE